MFIKIYGFLKGEGMIFLDNAGTTKMFDECGATYTHFACEEFFNPSAVSRESARVHSEIESARRVCLKKLGALTGTVIFTSGATESNNLAIKGSKKNGDFEYVFSYGEHPSVFNVARSLELSGQKVHFVDLNEAGKVDADKLKEVLSPKTRLISIMLVSNETGAINDVKEIVALKNQYAPRAVVHIDAVQGFMKIPFSVEDLGVDMVSFSAHKFHGPKGVGGLYVRNLNLIKNIVDGGGQEYNLRSGTENVPAIMAIKTALEKIDVKENFKRTTHLKEIFNKTLENCEGVKILDFGGSPYIEVLLFSCVKGETMLHALDEKGVIVGLGSACSAKKAGNRILENIGYNKEEIISSVRISFNAYMTEDEVKSAGEIIKKTYAEMLERLK